MTCKLELCNRTPYNGVYCSNCYGFNEISIMFKVIELIKYLKLVYTNFNETQYSRNQNGLCKVYSCQGYASPVLCVGCYKRFENSQLQIGINYLKNNKLWNYILTHNIIHITNNNWKDNIQATFLPIMYKNYDIIDLEINGIKYDNYNFKNFEFRKFMSFILMKFTNEQILNFYGISGNNAHNIPRNNRWKLNDNVYINNQDAINYLRSYIGFIIRLKTTFKLTILMDNNIYYLDIR